MKNIQTLFKYILLVIIIIVSLTFVQARFPSGSVIYYAHRVVITIFIAFPLGYFWYKILFKDFD